MIACKMLHHGFIHLIHHFHFPYPNQFKPTPTHFTLTITITNTITMTNHPSFDLFGLTTIPTKGEALASLKRLQEAWLAG